MTPSLLGIDASRASEATRTGTEWYSREIIRAIAELPDRPKLRLYQRDQERFVSANDVEWTSINRSRLWTHVGLVRELGRRPIDALFVPSHVIPWRHPKTTVVTIHDLGYRYEQAAHTLQRRLNLELTTRWNTRAATRIITPSNHTRSDLARDYGVEGSRIDVIPHGVDHERFRVLAPSEIEETLQRLGVRRPYLLFVSTLQPRKNLGRLVSAFEALDRPNLRLVVAGARGWKSDSILARMRSSSRSGDILQLGYVANEDLPALYNGAEAFVLPSLFEGFGMGVLEAMACGCPVVTSATTSLAEVAGDAAVRVDPRSIADLRDGIRRVLDPHQSASLRAAGLQHAVRFTWQGAAEQTLETIRRAHRETTD